MAHAVAGASGRSSRRRRAAEVVFASTVGNLLGVTPTVTATFGIFLAAIAGEFHWSRAAVSGALGVLSLATAVATPFAGRLADAIGARRTVLIGAALLATTIASLGFARAHPLWFYLQFAVIGAAGALPSGMVFAKLIAEWFETRRGLWIGVAGGVGNGLGATLLPILAATLLTLWGWRGGFVGIAAVVTVVGLPILFVFLHEPVAADAASAPPGESAGESAIALELEGVGVRDALRSSSFWLLVTALPIGGGCLTAVFAMVVPLLTARGVSLAVATTALAVFALTCTAWEPTVGYILDRTKGPRVLAPFYLAGAAGLVLLVTATSPIALMVSAVLMGLALGAEFSALSYLLSRFFGRRALGSLSGVAFGVVLGAGAVALVALNAVYDVSGSYFWGAVIIAPLLVWNGAALLLLVDYPFTPTTDSTTTAVD